MAKLELEKFVAYQEDLINLRLFMDVAYKLKALMGDGILPQQYSGNNLQSMFNFFNRMQEWEQVLAHLEVLDDNVKLELQTVAHDIRADDEIVKLLQGKWYQETDVKKTNKTKTMNDIDVKTFYSTLKEKTNVDDAKKPFEAVEINKNLKEFNRLYADAFSQMRFATMKNERLNFQEELQEIGQLMNAAIKDIKNLEDIETHRCAELGGAVERTQKERTEKIHALLEKAQKLFHITQQRLISGLEQNKTFLDLCNYFIERTHSSPLSPGVTRGRRIE